MIKMITMMRMGMRMTMMSLTIRDLAKKWRKKRARIRERCGTV